MKDLLILPILDYKILDKANFEKNQVTKLIEELTEFKNETDYLKKCNEYIDLLQVNLSFTNLFNPAILEQACLLNIEKHNKRKIFDIKGYYNIIAKK